MASCQKFTSPRPSTTFHRAEDRDGKPYGMCAQNGPQKDFLGTWYSLPSNFFLFLLPDQHVYVVKNICICTHIWLCTLVYELLLLPNNTVSESFLHKSGVVRRDDRIFITGYQPGSDWVNMWHWKKCFTRSSRNLTCFHIFFLVSLLEEAIIRNIR